MQPDRAFVIECYRRLLGREPENDAAVAQVMRGDKDVWGLISLFTESREFSSRAARRSSHSLCKAFDPDGLAKGLSSSDRMRSILATYCRLNDQLDAAALQRLFATSLPIWDAEAGTHGVTVSATLFEGSRTEGEVSLMASLEGRRVAVLTYTQVPADVFALAGEDVLLISRIQGYVGVEDDTRELSRRLGGIAPPYLLLAVLEGVAAAQGCGRLAGVAAHHHPDYRREDHAAFVAAYDGVFASLKSSLLPSGVHLMIPPLEGRPLASIARSHRARTRRKREAKRAIARAAEERWRSYLRAT